MTPGYSFSLIHRIVSLGSRLTPDQSTRYSSELYALWNQKGSSSIGSGVLSEGCEDLPQQHDEYDNHYTRP
ncbi:hypothetical protein Tco_0934864 [Tanacetum coccineum]